jgi:hypothetical protein
MHQINAKKQMIISGMAIPLKKYRVTGEIKANKATVIAAFPIF